MYVRVNQVAYPNLAKVIAVNVLERGPSVGYRLRAKAQGPNRAALLEEIYMCMRLAVSTLGSEAPTRSPKTREILGQVDWEALEEELGALTKAEPNELLETVAEGLLLAAQYMAPKA